MDKFANFTDIPSNAGSQWYLSGTALGELSPGDWSQQDQGKGASFHPGSLAPGCCSRAGLDEQPNPRGMRNAHTVSFALCCWVLGRVESVLGFINEAGTSRVL